MNIHTHRIELSECAALQRQSRDTRHVSEEKYAVRTENKTPLPRHCRYAPT